MQAARCQRAPRYPAEHLPQGLRSGIGQRKERACECPGEQRSPSGGARNAGAPRSGEKRAKLERPPWARHSNDGYHTPTTRAVHYGRDRHATGTTTWGRNIFTSRRWKEQGFRGHAKHSQGRCSGARCAGIATVPAARGRDATPGVAAQATRDGSDGFERGLLQLRSKRQQLLAETRS